MNRSSLPWPVAPDRDKPFTPRRSERLTAGGATRLQCADDYSVEVRVRNVSTCGFMAECAHPILIGSYIALDVPGIGPVHAQVRWQIGVSMGGMFLDPISLTQCQWTATRNDIAA